MLAKPAPNPEAHHIFAEPTPLGLIGLALGCAALTPIAFGRSLTPAGFATAGMFCLFFGAGCQMLAGLMSFANKNLYGGTLFTAFAFYWLLNWWALDGIATGSVIPDPGVLLASDVLALVIFLVFTYGFGFFSKLLFAFLVDIDLMFVAKVLNGVLGTHTFDLMVAVCTVALGVIALWIAFALLINPVAGRAIFPASGPMFHAPPPPPGFDFSARQAIFEVLYAQFRAHAFEPMGRAALEEQVGASCNAINLSSDLCYLEERGGVRLDRSDTDEVLGVRLTAAGIDLYEQRVLAK